LLQVEDHIFDDLIEHFHEFTAQEQSHLAFSVKVMLSVSNAFAKDGDEVGWVGKDLRTIGLDGHFGRAASLLLSGYAAVEHSFYLLSSGPVCFS
jgi:hypothetical protein